MDLELLLQLTRDQRLIVDYVYVASAVILLHDHLYTLEKEVSLIWCSRWTYTKILFLVTRYLPFPGIYLILYSQIVPDISPSACSRIFQAFTWLTIVAICCAEGIFMIRTWAVWNRNRSVGFVLSALACGVGMVFLAELYLLALSTTKLQAASPPFSGRRGCSGISPVHPILYSSMYWIAFVDVVVLSLMVVSAFQAYKHGDNFKLSNVIHRDGILFYFYILCLVMTDGIILHSAPPTFVNVFIPVPLVCYSLLSARVILNIRDVAQEAYSESGNLDFRNELHTTYGEHADLQGLPLALTNECSSEEHIESTNSSH